ncbi:MAG TPA: alpha/beta hydrolase [Acidimicrobiales bacterium]|nr:alpha/beta hydrolase [Acidimicrobiales bacterium]
MPLLDVHGQPVNVIDRGEGEALVFLHAFPLQAAMWDYQIDALDGSHRCIAIDMPGFGQSPPPEAPDAASMQAWAGLVVGVLDQLGVETATFVGASMGGYLAMALLRHHPDRVHQLVLADSRARSDDPGVAQRRSAQQDRLREGTEVEVLSKEVVEGLLSSGSMSRSDLVEYVHALAAGADAEGWIAALEAMKDRPDSMLLLRRADVRALVLVGELDRVTPIAEAMSLRSLLKGELVVVPNVGHLPNVEDPLAFNEALLSFLGVPAASDDAAAAAPDGAAADGVGDEVAPA